jgi:predicted metal-dependent hydrolase
MITEVKLNNKIIFCHINKRRGAKTLRLSVSPNGEVNISAPCFYPKYLILRFIKKKSKWLEDKLNNWQASDLQLISQKNRVDYLKDKEKARTLILERLEYFNNFYNFQFNQIRIKNQKNSWGSCSRKKNLNFNFRIFYLPAKQRDYVIVHELCHLKELNHSSNFWQLVGLVVPDYKEIRRELRGRSVN